jgi:hypothetical protein
MLRYFGAATTLIIVGISDGTVAFFYMPSNSFVLLAIYGKLYRALLNSSTPLQCRKNLQRVFA